MLSALSKNEVCFSSSSTPQMICSVLVLTLFPKIKLFQLGNILCFSMFVWYETILNPNTMDNPLTYCVQIYAQTHSLINVLTFLFNKV